MLRIFNFCKHSYALYSFYVSIFTHLMIIIFDVVVHAVFIERIDKDHKEKRVQCRYCKKKLRAKHINWQRKHLIIYVFYLIHMNVNSFFNVITRTINAQQFDIQQLIFSVINKTKRKKLNRKIIFVIYCGGCFLNMLKNSWMRDFFIKDIDYISSRKTKLNENLLNETYLRTKEIITKLIENNSILSLTMNENDN